MANHIETAWKVLVDAGWSIDVGSRAVAWIDANTFTTEHVTTPADTLGAPAIPPSLERSFEYRARQYRTDVLHARGNARRHRIGVVSRGRLVPH